MQSPSLFSYNSTIRGQLPDDQKIDSVRIHRQGTVKCIDGWFDQPKWVPIYANGLQWTPVAYRASSGMGLMYGRVSTHVTQDVSNVRNPFVCQFVCQFVSICTIIQICVIYMLHM